jgi:hypothetical protein
MSNVLNVRRFDQQLIWTGMEFDKKKQKYYQKKTGGSPFQITSRVLKETEWTPSVFATHQTDAVAKLKTIWDL